MVRRRPAQDCQQTALEHEPAIPRIGRAGQPMRTPMLSTPYRYLASLAAALLVPTLVAADDDVTNRLSLSARVGFNIPVHFANLSSLPAPSLMRRTPRGD